MSPDALPSGRDPLLHCINLADVAWLQRIDIDAHEPRHRLYPCSNALCFLIPLEHSDIAAVVLIGHSHFAVAIAFARAAPNTALKRLSMTFCALSL
jgi:hypothetical protein